MRRSRDAERCRHIGRLEALRDMLRAVRIPGLDREQHDLLGPRLVAFRHQPLHQRGIVLDDARLAPDLDALAVRIVDQEQMRLGVVGQIAAGDILPVAGKIGKGDRLVVEHVQEAGRAAAMLDVGLAVGARRRQEHAGLGGDEGSEVRRDGCAPAAALFHRGIAVPRALALLDRLDRRRERDIAGIMAGNLIDITGRRRHGGPPATVRADVGPSKSGAYPAVSGTILSKSGRTWIVSRR